MVIFEIFERKRTLEQEASGWNFLNNFHVIRHKKGNNNVIVVYCSHALLSNLETKFLGFECTNELCEHDTDFSYKYQTCSHTPSYGQFTPCR